MGVGMSNNGQRYSKSSLISSYVHNKLAKLDKEEWQKNIDLYKDINLDNSYEANDQNILIASYDQIKDILKSLPGNRPRLNFVQVDIAQRKHCQCAE